MPSKKNVATVNLLKTKLKNAKSLVFADASGLSVNLQRELRQAVKLAGGELIVVKNTLLKLALGVKEILPGPTITLLAYGDEIAPIKALAEFAKAHELPKIKAGFLAKEPLAKDQVETLANLPTKIELLTKTIGTLQAPISGFVNVLQGNLRKLVYVLSAIGGRGAVKEHDR
ncbi:50S ribosomal protein L10 [Candidatus Beckwithbacteria bacterium CG22_combo_CG10-13_8_21_14_all_01_47_9]|uniref:Large ribosomal subunit protein uL10 n=4 Tax=Candidatus Beckwithiibacteriota TaxID=1752726 RepID=A0A2H0E1Y3_9BACT|nr:MAG: 50S ribosomal protein L10 [Candidatus Beckwithbacteria bacterium CG1_02_47_37]PIP52573.1 MAG: 50S ribosomal protein L10 [Candidatus Beckwithbacteria bacterium CG23_combo_of_CG06-09_8_20_14_all_47_9]PIP88443.1 MAG: 50S ribosomal protein L10 [Candidatus Beckwithbacteria bacterium CG22_combo_CG10-13_8_21_14_all_01_47_9]PJA22339.1 MAG: 50S ribosomal protein L10 [Candidatus Beckwithbacteria bacterium CG_4_10_14_0_2_um_filter_47_25]